MTKIEKRLAKVTGRTESVAEEVGKSLVKAFHLLALFVIGRTIVLLALGVLVLRYGSYKYPSKEAA